MSNTPRTDAVLSLHVAPGRRDEFVSANFARELEQENQKLREALGFYADYRTYVSYTGDNDTAAIEQDAGQRAREILK